MNSVMLPVNYKSSLLAGLVLVFSSSAQSKVVQFFGDFYQADQPSDKTRVERPLSEVRSLLSEATFNIVNFEGVATSAQVPHEFKRHLLRMPLSTGDMLRSEGVHVATLANNHSMDFGYQGLFDTTWALEKAQIIVTGAGNNSAEAEKELLLTVGPASLCIIAVSRTLPDSFWATQSSAGTAAPADSALLAKVRTCAALGHLPVVTLHWGQELSVHASQHQHALAKKIIDAGALAVLGHHPHVVQQVSFHRGRPIIPSLGNFFFQSHSKRRTTGMAAQLHFQPTGITLHLVPLVVSNGAQSVKPRLLMKGDEDPLKLAGNAPCRLADSQSRRRTCTVSYPTRSYSTRSEASSQATPVAVGPLQSGKAL